MDKALGELGSYQSRFHKEPVGLSAGGELPPEIWRTPLSDPIYFTSAMLSEETSQVVEWG